MELVHVKGNTYYFESELLIPIYKVGDTECILIDNGSLEVIIDDCMKLYKTAYQTEFYDEIMYLKVYNKIK